MIERYADHAANERTFLAWVRTGIATIAFGFVVEKFNLFVLTLAEANSIDAAKRIQLEKFSGSFSHYDGLALIVQVTLKRDPHCGHLFVFRGRSGALIKCLWWDGQGLCLFAKRLERGRFLWPSTAGGAVTISSAQLGYLLSGIDWRMPQETWRPSASG